MTADSAPPDRGHWSWAAAIGITFFLVSLNIAARQDSWKEYDESTFLQLAAEIEREGGVVVLFRDLFSGRFKMANQHPLYPAVLSLLTMNEIESFHQAKIVDCFIASLTVMAVCVLGTRIFGFFEGVTAALLLGFSARWLEHASQVTVDPLLTLFMVCGWGYIVIAARTGLLTYAALAGAYAALAYLTKGYGLFLLPLWAAVAIGTRGWSALWRRRTIVFVLTFLVVALPLLWRNSVVYANPFHNQNSQIMWTEEWSALWDPEVYRDPPTAMTYLDEYGAAHAWQRLSRGLRAFFLWIVEDSRPFFVGGAWWWSAGTLGMVAALAALFRDPERERKMASMAYLFLFWLNFGWFLHFANQARFALPVVPIMLLYMCSAIRLFPGTVRPNRLFLRKRLSRLLAAGLALVSAYSAGMLVIGGHDGWRIRPEQQRQWTGWSNPATPLEDSLYGRDATEYFLRQAKAVGAKTRFDNRP